MYPSQPTEADLILRVQAGDESAFEQLFILYTPKLYRVLRRITSDAHEAEAIVQETFLRAWQNRHRYQDDRPVFPYLVTIALNLGRDQWRRARFVDFSGLEPISESLTDLEPSPEKQVDDRERLEALARAVAELPPAYRAVIALRYDAEMSYAAIAVTLDIPINTVRTHLRRAKQHLRRTLEEQDLIDG